MRDNDQRRLLEVRAELAEVTERQTKLQAEHDRLVATMTDAAGRSDKHYRPPEPE